MFLLHPIVASVLVPCAFAVAVPSQPEHFEGGLAFMFETTYILKVSEWAKTCKHREADYAACWDDMPKMFDPTNPDAGLKPAPKKTA